MSDNANFTQSGMVNQANKIINGWLSLDCWCHLYLVGGLSISEHTTLANCLAVEANYIGYAPQRLTTWSAPTIQPLSGALQHYALTQSPAVFPIADPAGSGSLQGYFLTDALFSQLFGVSNFNLSNPVVVPNGETFNLTVEYLIISYFPYPPANLP